MAFANKVVVVTGAGNGLGKVYALDFARQGASVVVNDLGGSTSGAGADSKAADLVVAEIKKNGGKAVANYDSVVNGAKIIETAVKAFGRVDVVINNAGILRDVAFHKMTDADWDKLYEVHLKGSYAVTRAAWDVMRTQKFGRIINVASAAGIYGNFGQAQYSSFKLGLVGLSNTLALEGAKLNIHTNTIAPLAASRMTEKVLPPDVLQALKPEYVAPLVMWLCHADCKENGSLFEVGAGWVAKLRWQRTQGGFFPINAPLTIEHVRDNWSKIMSFDEGAQYPRTPQDSFAPIMANLAGDVPASTSAASKPKKQAGGGSGIDPSKALGYQFPDDKYTYTQRDTQLYALSIGAARDPLDASELKFVYENAENFQVLPTFGVTASWGMFSQLMQAPGMSFNPMTLLHGEQMLELKKPLPASGTLLNKGKIAHIYDKGKAAVVVLHLRSYDESGAEVLFQESTIFLRGSGGFGGDKGPAQPKNDPPATPPHIVFSEQTAPNQAALYRLTGDTNPLHIDPAFAKMGGFDAPILHGLCFFGFAQRAVIKSFCGNDANRFRSIRARFAASVYPGERLITEMWLTAPNTVMFRCKVAERGAYVLTGGIAEIVPDPAYAAAAPVAAAAAPAAVAVKGDFKAAAAFAEIGKRMAAEGAAMVKKVGCIYRFDLTAADGAQGSWVIDLKNGSGAVRACANTEKADCMIAMKDADFLLLMTGKLNAQQAFMKGQLKIKGNMMLAQKLEVLTKATPKL